MDALSIEDIKKKKWDAEHIREGHYLKDFISGGIMPFALEEPDVISMQNNILDKIIYRNIPFVS